MRTVDVAPEGALSRSTAVTTGGDTEYRSLRRAVQAWTAALILLCAGSLWLQFRHIEHSLPYPHHVDEQFVAGPARRMLISGNLNPRPISPVRRCRVTSRPLASAPGSSAARDISKAGTSGCSAASRIPTTRFPGRCKRPDNCSPSWRSSLWLPQGSYPGLRFENRRPSFSHRSFCGRPRSFSIVPGDI